MSANRHLERRIAELERRVPKKIVLTLDDGSTYHHSGPALRFYMEGMDEIQAGQGPLVEAVARTVRAEGCGLLWQLLAAIAGGPAR